MNHLPILATRREPDPEYTAERLDRLTFESAFPLTDAPTTTFAYRGAADSVRLVHFGSGLPDDLSFVRVADSDWWLLALDLPEGTRLEYQIEVRHGDRHDVIEDPLNPFEARNPFGQNSVCRSLGYTVPPWALNDPEAPAGSHRSLHVLSEALGRSVRVNLLLPASFSADPEHPYPLVVLHDGTDYLHYAAAATVIENLVHRALVPEIVVAFCDPQDRLTEYANDERHARFIVEELVPNLESHLPLIGGRDGRCLGGASFGAVATLSTAVRHPDAFGRLLLQSGSFAGADADRPDRPDDLWRPVHEFVRAYVADPTKVADRVFMSCGLFEALIAENRALRPILAEHGMQVVLGEVADGHTWGCWRDLLGIGLPWLFADTFRAREPRPYDRPERPASFEPVDVGGSSDG